MLYQYEPKFDIVHIKPDGFSSVFIKHRNILKVVCSSDIESTSITAEYNVSASPQIVLTLQGPSIRAMADYIKEHGDELLQMLEVAERNRTIDNAQVNCSEELKSSIRSRFGIDMPVSSSYIIRNEKDNFVWASIEYPRASQGFFVYSHPLNEKDSLSAKALVEARNNAAKQIPGPADGSYMTTVTRMPNEKGDGYVEYLPQRKAIEINGRQWVELRGFWEVKGDYMGGPFVSYTTLDERTNQLFTIDCYLYSPKDDNRNMLHQLEHIVYGVSIPTQK
jgi:hypothetical protein